MVVGTCEVDLYIPESNSLKTKRRVIKGIKDKLRSRFNISVTEINANNLWQRASLAMAVVNENSKAVNQTLQNVLKVVETDSRAQLLDYRISLL